MKWGLIIAAVAIIWVIFRARTARFLCPECHHEFQVGILGYITAPHMLSKRLVTCPNCGHRGMLSPEN